jgi:hypothetical protein
MAIFRYSTTLMLQLPLKLSFEKFRRELSPSARSDLDLLAQRLNLFKGPEVMRGDYLTGFTRVLCAVAPTFSQEEYTALAFYAVCARCDPSVWPSSASLMAARQQMQEMQMSFNLQYLMLQENVQNDSRLFTCLSNLMNTKFNTMKGVLANIK